MAGRNSIAIATDSRFGLGFQTVSANTNTAASPTKRLFLPPDTHSTMVAWTGLLGDGTTFSEELSALLANKARRAGGMAFPNDRDDDDDDDGRGTRRNREMSPGAVATIASHLLYRRRSAPYYVETVVAGLEDVRVPVVWMEEEEEEKGQGKEERKAESSKTIYGDIEGEMTNARATSITGSDRVSHRELPMQSLLRTATTSPGTPPRQRHRHRHRQTRTIRKPYLCTTDMLGARSTSDSFVCSGVASRSLHGTAEALWRPELEGEELVEVCGKAFVSALERDCLSGYGAVVYLIRAVGEEGDVEIWEYVLDCRND